MNNTKYKITLKNTLKHFHMVNKHRFLVFKLSIKAGIPLQGLVHDLSKYSPTEFFESVKYYQGTYSPIRNCRNEIGYSKAWLHHKGRNKHHYEYWYDYRNKPGYEAIVIPLKYTKEMICDQLAAGMCYEGKKWNNSFQLGYWNREREKAKIDERIDKLLIRVYTDISKYGVKKVLKSKNLNKLYKEYVGD